MRRTPSGKLIDALLRATLLAVPLAGCPCPSPLHRVDTTASRAMFAAQIDACLASDDACEALCRAVLDVPPESAIDRCTITAVRAEDVSLSVTVNDGGQCIGGRRPDGFAEPRCTATARGWLAHVATLEAASVTAFARLVRALAHHGAPAALVAQARAAIADELLHAQLVARLAGGAAAPVIEPREMPSLAALALENAVEGEVGERFGALVAAIQARTATDPEVRAVCGVLAVDEARHAAFSHELAGWLAPQLAPEARAEVARRRAAAIASLGDVGADLDAGARAMLGLPAPALLASAARELFAA